MALARWTLKDVPSQTARRIVITGANSGLGFYTAKALAARGAHVIMACRNQSKADGAIAAIREAVPGAELTFIPLDLSSLRSVEDFSTTLAERFHHIDGLVNNAGVMAVPYSLTEDGFERQLGTNHLGHFALTARLLPMLRACEGTGRIVHVSSLASKAGRFDNFDDLNTGEGYEEWRAYGRSKLANLLFHYGLQRRLEAALVPVLTLAAHPGYAATNLQFVAAQEKGSTFMERFMALGNSILAQSAERGALPQLRALTAPDAVSGEFYGPDGLFQMRGEPVVVEPTPRALNESDQDALWKASEALTGLTFPFSPVATS